MKEKLVITAEEHTVNLSEGFYVPTTASEQP
jgi:hypothetical protein